MKTPFYSSDYKTKNWTLEKISKLTDIVEKKDNTYLVKGTVVISKKHILEINNVACISFYKDCALVIDGKFNIGNENAKTIFTSNKPGISKEDRGWPNGWKGLIIKGRGTIKNCIFKDSIIGIYIIKGNVKILNNQIISHRYGIRCDKAKAVIKNNRFEHCSDGIFLYHAKQMKINNNTFVNNGCGVYCFFSSGLINKNLISITKKDFIKPEFSGIYCYNSDFKIEDCIIKGTPVALVCGMNSGLKLINNCLESPRNLHIFNSDLHFDIQISKLNIAILSGNDKTLTIGKRCVKLPKTASEKFPVNICDNFSFYKDVAGKISDLKVKEIKKLIVNSEKANIPLGHYKNNMYIRLIKSLFNSMKALKQACFMYVISNNKKYIPKIKAIIKQNEGFFNDELWKIQPGLDIPYSYCLNAYTICHNSIKNAKYFSEETRIIKERIEELYKHNEWWLREVKGVGTHQDLLASSSLFLAGLEFKKYDKLDEWKNLFYTMLDASLKNKQYYTKTETPIFLFEVFYYLKGREFDDFIKGQELEHLFRKAFGKDMITSYLKRSLA